MEAQDSATDFDGIDRFSFICRPGYTLGFSLLILSFGLKWAVPSRERAQTWSGLNTIVLKSFGLYAVISLMLEIQSIAANEIGLEHPIEASQVPVLASAKASAHNCLTILFGYVLVAFWTRDLGVAATFSTVFVVQFVFYKISAFSVQRIFVQLEPFFQLSRPEYLTNISSTLMSMGASLLSSSSRNSVESEHRKDDEPVRQWKDIVAYLRSDRCELRKLLSKATLAYIYAWLHLFIMYLFVWLISFYVNAYMKMSGTKSNDLFSASILDPYYSVLTFDQSVPLAIGSSAFIARMLEINHSRFEIYPLKHEESKLEACNLPSSNSIDLKSKLFEKLDL